MNVEEHDAILAATSHLPHFLSYSLVDTLAGLEDKREIFRFAAGGFRDFTRIAASDPVMWRDIALANREVELLLSPLYRPLSKPAAGPLLDRSGLEALKRAERERIHLMGGLTAKRIAPLVAGRFAGFAVKTVWHGKPEVFLENMGTRL